MARTSRLAKTAELPSTLEIAAEPVTIGIDLGDRYSHCCVLRPDGTVLVAGRIRTTPEALASYFERLPPARIAIEVGTHSRWSTRFAAS